MSDWRDVVLHFGKNQGTPLGELDSQALDWYIQKWQPKGYFNKKANRDMPPSAADLDLRAWLDQAGNELDGTQVPPEPRRPQAPPPRQAQPRPVQPVRPAITQPRPPNAQNGRDLTFLQACELYGACLEFVVGCRDIPAEALGAGVSTLFIYCSTRGIMPSVIHRPAPQSQPASEPPQPEEPENIPF
jgi:hypothetical protein